MIHHEKQIPTLSDLDEEQIEYFISAVKEKGRFSIPTKAKNIDILRKLALIQDGRSTRAALLLFGNNPNLFSSSAFLKMGRFRSSTHIVDKRQLAAIAYVREHGSISNTEFQTLVGVSKRTATRDLNILTKTGIFTLEGSTGRGTIYKLKGS